MSNVWQRVQVVATSAVTWISTASFVVVVLAEEISKVVAPDSAETVTRVSVRIVALLGAVVAIIRRVSPVAIADRGLLPPQH